MRSGIAWFSSPLRSDYDSAVHRNDRTMNKGSRIGCQP
ncbi:MAG: hypothetical protein JWN34_6041, partial [Bryobacterales bacterium]|nr:hypothetical protein [Bryobacterales bacterium]